MRETTFVLDVIKLHVKQFKTTIQNSSVLYSLLLHDYGENVIDIVFLYGKTVKMILL